jgi:hypothetical protein
LEDADVVWRVATEATRFLPGLPRGHGRSRKLPSPFLRLPAGLLHKGSTGSRWVPLEGIVHEKNGWKAAQGAARRHGIAGADRTPRCMDKRVTQKRGDAEARRQTPRSIGPRHASLGAR